jgi:hypothetical protein
MGQDSNPGPPKQEVQVYNILYTVSTQQHQYSDIMYAIGKKKSASFSRHILALN